MLKQPYIKYLHRNLIIQIAGWTIILVRTAGRRRFWFVTTEPTTVELGWNVFPRRWGFVVIVTWPERFAP